MQPDSDKSISYNQPTNYPLIETNSDKSERAKLILTNANLKPEEIKNKLLEETKNKLNDKKNEIVIANLKIIGLKASSIGLGTVGVLLAPFIVPFGAIVGSGIGLFAMFQKKNLPIGVEVKQESKTDTFLKWVKAGALGFYLLAEIQWRDAKEVEKDLSIDKGIKEDLTAEKNQIKFNIKEAEKENAKEEIKNIDAQIKNTVENFKKIKENADKEVEKLEKSFETGKQTIIDEVNQEIINRSKNPKIFTNSKLTKTQNQIKEDRIKNLETKFNSDLEIINMKIRTEKSKASNEIKNLNSKKKDLEEKYKLKYKPTKQSLSPIQKSNPTYTGL